MPLAPSPDDLFAATDILRRVGDPRRGLCRALVRLLNADVAMVWEQRDDQLRLTASCDTGPGIAPRLSLGPESAAGRVASHGTGWFTADVEAGPEADARFARRLGLRAVLAEPLRTDGGAAGVVVVGWRHPVGAPDPFVPGVVALMAAQAATAIERADLAERLEHQALTDPLTDLWNRRGLARELDREMARTRRHGTALGFALMDLDNFKAYNDERGHAAGDRLLVRAARSWATHIRVQDTLARWGGEEFVVLLPDCGPGQALALDVVERVRAATPDAQTASVGLAIWDGREPAHQLAERADAALYAAKEHGRDRALAA